MAKILFILNEPWDSALTHYTSGVLSAAAREHETLLACLKGSFIDKHYWGLRFHISQSRNSPIDIKRLLSVILDYKPHLVVTIKGDATLDTCVLKTLNEHRIMRIFGEAKELKTPAICMDKIILPSAVIKKFLKPSLKKRVSVIRGFVDRRIFRFDPAERQKWRNRLGTKENELLIGAIGRLDLVKGYGLLIEAFAKSNMKAKLAIVGQEKSQKTKELEGLAFKYGIKERVIIINKRVENPAGFMSALDIGAISSIASEVIARVAFEFMSVGLPIVSTDVGMLPEIMKPSFSILTKPNPEDFKKALQQMASKNLKTCSKHALKEAALYDKNRFERLQLNQINALLTDCR